MLRREFFVKLGLGLGVLAMAAAPLVMQRPVRAVVSDDPEIEWKVVSGIRPWVPATLEQQQYVDEFMANRPSHS